MNASEVCSLLKESRRYSKIKSDSCDALKVAVVGTCSLQFFSVALDYVLYKQGLDIRTYEGHYDSINSEILDTHSGLYEFNPDIVIIVPYYTDINGYPPLLANEEVVDEAIRRQFAWFEKLWDFLSRIKGCHILQSNIVLPIERQLGNLEANVASSRLLFMEQINLLMAKKHPSFVTIVDLDYVASLIGKANWFDNAGYFNAKLGYKMDCLPMVVDLFAKQIVAQKKSGRKCLVLDLDNTLWGGVVGDVGAEGIRIDPNDALGEAYRHFQEYILSLKERGVMVAVCSKNDEDIAKEPFLTNCHMVLSLDDIVCFVANWDDKASNIRKIAQQVNIGLDSIVFFDDNPAERDIVKKFLPQVCVIDVPDDPANFAMSLELEGPFEWSQLTKEDIQRTGSYVANSNRSRLEGEFVDYDSYLDALDMKAKVWEVDEGSAPRFAQLINKTNQFNLRTKRYSEAQIEAFRHDPNILCLCGSLEDKFGDYGLISCLILRRQDPESFFIDTWVMSCRVLKRGMEYLMLSAALDILKAMGVVRVFSEFIPSEKNSMVSNLYDGLGFSIDSRASNGSVVYVASIQGLQMPKHFIERMS